MKQLMAYLVHCVLSSWTQSASTRHFPLRCLSFKHKKLLRTAKPKNERQAIVGMTPPIASNVRTTYSRPSPFGGGGITFLKTPANGKTAMREVKTLWEK
jgi:hypothetical protein